MMDQDELEQLTGAWETYQQEVDRRFDRLAKRITDLETYLERRIAEAELLAIRNHIDLQVAELQHADEHGAAALDIQTELLEGLLADKERARLTRLERGSKKCGD